MFYDLCVDLFVFFIKLIRQYVSYIFCYLLLIVFVVIYFVICWFVLVYYYIFYDLYLVVFMVCFISSYLLLFVYVIVFCYLLLLFIIDFCYLLLIFVIYYWFFLWCLFLYVPFGRRMRVPTARVKIVFLCGGEALPVQTWILVPLALASSYQRDQDSFWEQHIYIYKNKYKYK